MQRGPKRVGPLLQESVFHSLLITLWHQRVSGGVGWVAKKLFIAKTHNCKSMCQNGASSQLSYTCIYLLLAKTDIILSQCRPKKKYLYIQVYFYPICYFSRSSVVSLICSLSTSKLEVSPFQERCAMLPSQGLLSSSYGINFMIFQPILLQHTQNQSNCIIL